jgi:hypothetical protein
MEEKIKEVICGIALTAEVIVGLTEVAIST